MAGFLVRRDPNSTAAKVARRLWSSQPSFGLACPLDDLPQPRAARIPVKMEAQDPSTFQGFVKEQGHDLSEAEAEFIRQRVEMCQEGVRTLYAALDPEGEAIYAQWLLKPGDEQALHHAAPGYFPDLESDETMVEGAYTFTSFRGHGAMGDGMHQLLEIAQATGAARCLTYVGFDNIASLRGCHKVGFELDHVREAQRRLNVRHFARRLPTAEERRIWTEAVS
jgi:RimJ/RimL family protein N-acetyltransferase